MKLKEAQTKKAAKYISRNRDVLILVGLCLLCNGYKLLFSCFYAEPGLQTPQDIFSLFYSAAYFGGKDWSAIGKEYSAYYGYGFIALFSWMYRFIKDGLFIYRFILVCCHLLTIISCILCYKIVVFFQFPVSKWVIYFLCISCTSIQGTSSCGIANEHALNVCVWGILFLLMQLCAEDIRGNRKIKYTILLGALLAYSCTVHARAVIMYLLVLLCIAAVRITRKRYIVNIPAILGVSLLYIPHAVFADKLQVMLLGEVNSNSSIIAKASNGIGGGFSWEKLGTFFMSIAAYFHELSVLSAGISIVCLGCVLYVGYMFYKKQEFGQGMGIEAGNRLLCGLIFSISGIGAFLVGMCFSARSEIYRGITVPINSFLRYLTLVRYFMPFVAPMALFTLILVMKLNACIRRKILLCSMGALIVIQIIFIRHVFPLIKFTGWANGVYLPYTWDVEMKREDVYLVGGVMLLFAICFLVFWLIRKEKWLFLCATILIFNVNGTMYRFVHQVKEVKQFELVDGGYQHFYQEENSRDIYVVETEKEDGMAITDYYFLYQLLLPNMHIIPEEPRNDLDGAFILTNNPEAVSNYEKYEIMKLDENEWILFN